MSGGARGPALATDPRHFDAGVPPVGQADPGDRQLCGELSADLQASFQEGHRASGSGRRAPSRGHQSLRQVPSRGPKFFGVHLPGVPLHGRSGQAPEHHQVFGEVAQLLPDLSGHGVCRQPQRGADASRPPWAADGRVGGQQLFRAGGAGSGTFALQEHRAPGHLLAAPGDLHARGERQGARPPRGLPKCHVGPAQHDLPHCVRRDAVHGAGDGPRRPLLAPQRGRVELWCGAAGDGWGAGLPEPGRALGGGPSVHSCGSAAILRGSSEPRGSFGGFVGGGHHHGHRAAGAAAGAQSR
mmetsp:Transcript_46017/g.109337  ORF Transcript_46017/g.109337 Transcript_46017/m.109337 type:complete len:298 (-) Transcript_46017:132-1025(-)